MARRRLVDILRDQDAHRGNGKGKAHPPWESSSSPSPSPSDDSAHDAAPGFPATITASQLQRCDPARAWLWRGYLAPGAITLFSALWKAGKTTLLAHLLRALQSEETFCGLECSAARVLYVSEEGQSRWAERRDSIGIGDHASFVLQPFILRPDWVTWVAFIDHVKAEAERLDAALVVFDTLSNLWPVKDENDAAKVQAALMPLRKLTAGDTRALLLAHHLRKGDGAEATGSRGSGALPAFVDTILELRRFEASDRHDRRRVLTGYGRAEETPSELVIELTADGNGYRTHGDRQELAGNELREQIFSLLPNEPPGWTADEVRSNWPDDPPPRNQRLRQALQNGADSGNWRREGDGKRGAPFTFWTPPGG